MNFSYIPPENREEHTDTERSGLQPAELQTYRTLRSLHRIKDEGEYYDREDKWD